MREWLGPDYPLVRKLMGKESPDALATRLIAETEINDADFRKRLWLGGKAAVDASRDPMIALARSIDGEARAIRRQYEDEVEAPIDGAAEKIAAARFKAYGTHIYPDATFTPRLNYGTVQGWVENGTSVQPFSYLARAFERATGAAPFKIPDSWMRVKARLDMNAPFCISTSNDIVGGNSGSPLIDVDGKIVGLMFDGNIHSIAGRYWFNPDNNRAIALHPAIIREALEKVYDAKRAAAGIAAAPGGSPALDGHPLKYSRQKPPVGGGPEALNDVQNCRVAADEDARFVAFNPSNYALRRRGWRGARHALEAIPDILHAHAFAQLIAGARFARNVGLHAAGMYDREPHGALVHCEFVPQRL